MAFDSMKVSFLICSTFLVVSPFPCIDFGLALNAEDVPLANGAMSFNRVCREWRCKYEGNKSGTFDHTFL